MIEPKETIFTILSGLGYRVYQRRPEVIQEFPSMSFYIMENVPDFDLAKDINYQAGQVVVDIWGNNSKETGEILVALEQTMRNGGYLLGFNGDVDEPTGYSHVTTRFNFIL